MKKIFFLFAMSISLNCSSQTMLAFDTSFVNNNSKELFIKNPSIKTINFSYNRRYNIDSSRFVSLSFKKEKSDSNTLGSEYYNLHFIGDRYLFEKKYGALLLPEKEIQAVLNKRYMPYFYLHLNASSDSINLKLESLCWTDDDSDKFFIKVELLGHYKFGMKKLEKEIQSALAKKYFSDKRILTDSFYFFKAIITNKDSCLLQVDLTDGQPSLFTAIIIDELNHLCSWVPSFQSGRAVKTYLKIFVRLNKDRSVTVAYPE